jgi:hypothetical protein
MEVYVNISTLSELSGIKYQQHPVQYIHLEASSFGHERLKNAFCLQLLTNTCMPHYVFLLDVSKQILTIYPRTLNPRNQLNSEKKDGK